MFGNIFAGKKVLVTGHTGFKGTWLSLWLLELGAKVYGLSNDIPTNPSIFEAVGLEGRIDHLFADVRNYDAVYDRISAVQPDFVFHLAAQPIVSLSYQEPLSTILTNAMGTANVLEACRKIDEECVILAITSDKCYNNVEWEWGYRENDALGGKDIYSASKAAAEMIFHAYYKSFFSRVDTKSVVASVRAGNVIGGGDWAQDRIVVDCVLSWSENKPVTVRNPEATRPWQHVLEPLSGYLALAAELTTRRELNGESFNFGPKSEQSRTVVELLSDLARHWTGQRSETPYRIIDNAPFNEAELLKLNCDKALYHLKWRPTLEYAECVEMVGSWYSAYYSGGCDMHELSLDQIRSYNSRAEKANVAWATS